MALKFLNNGYFAGKVGIGTIDPVSILDIFSTAPTLTIGGVAVNQVESGRIRFTEDASTADFQGSYIHYDGSENKLHIGMHDPANTSVSNDVNAITIKRTNAYVGIGTVSPDYRLSVNGNIQSDFIRSYTYPNNSFLDFDDDQTASSNHTRLASVGRITYLADTNDNEPAANAAHEFFTGTSDIDTATSLMIIATSGSVGIGNPTPIFYSGYSSLNIGGTSGTTRGLIKFGTGTSNDGPEIFTTPDKDLYFNKAGSGTNLILFGTGAIRFNNYNSTNNTGTPTYLLGTDGSGNVVKTLSTPGGDPGPYLPLAGGTMDSGAAITFVVPSAGGNFINIDHTGNENWSFGAQSGSGVDDYIDIGINGGTRAMSWHEDGNVGIGTTSPDAKLDIEAAINPTIRLTNSTDPLGSADVGTLEFFTKDSSTAASRVLSSIVCVNSAASP